MLLNKRYEVKIPPILKTNGCFSLIIINNHYSLGAINWNTMISIKIKICTKSFTTLSLQFFLKEITNWCVINNKKDYYILKDSSNIYLWGD